MCDLRLVRRWSSGVTASGPALLRKLTMWALVAALITPTVGEGWSADWMTRGPEGGNVNVLAVHPTNHDVLYAGTDGGLFKSLDAGASWTSSSSGLSPRALAVNALQFKPGSPSILYAGTPAGFFRSTDDGANWSGGPLPPGYGEVRAIAVHPSIPNAIYALTPYYLLKSSDSGLTWVDISAGLPTASVNLLSITIDPQNAQRLFVGSYGKGIFRSSNGGGSWTPVNSGLADYGNGNFAGASMLAVDPANSSRVFASMNDGLYRTLDAGASWNRIISGGVELVKYSENALYAGYATSFGLLKSLDGGGTFQQLATGFPSNTSVRDVAAVPGDTSRLFVGTVGGGNAQNVGFGFARSTDGGATLQVSNAGLVATIVDHVVVDPADSQHVFGAGTGFFRSVDRGQSWQGASTGLYVKEFRSMIAAGVPTSLYLAPSFDFSGFVDQIAKSIDQGASWSYVGAEIPDSFSLGDCTVQALDAAPGNQAILYAGGYCSSPSLSSVYRSSDSGSTWTSAGAGMEGRYVTDLAVDSLDDEVVLIVADGLLFRTEDSGASWTQVLSGLANVRLQQVEYDPLVIGRVIAGGFSIDPSGPSGYQTYLSFDGGQSWQIWGALGSDCGLIGGLEISPHYPQVAYAVQSGCGVLKTMNGGRDWFKINSGLANLQAFDVEIDPTSPGRVYAGTVGSGIFALDDQCGDGIVNAGETCDLGPQNGVVGFCCSETCQIRNAGFACRPPTDLCDAAELCNGSSTNCPTDAISSAGTTCRVASGACDVAESCNGSSKVCPGDGFRSIGDSCRPAAGPCDSAEVCTGNSSECPFDYVLPSFVSCRSAAGDCDVAEFCDGSNSQCPSDVMAAQGTTCRAAQGACDVAEVCSGSSALCPVDVLASTETVCRTAAGPCDVAESCTGTSKNCPTDNFASSTEVCRAATGLCDVAERCTGSGAICPPDVFASSTVQCRAANGTCDIAESCSGTSGTCPADKFANAGTQCRATAGVCDLAETCTGTSGVCPTDVFAPATTECRAATGSCDVAEKCTGTSAACPADAFASATKECRAASGACDIAEKCSGTSAACPVDAFAPATTQCRAASGACDVAERCTGASGACPADGFAPAVTECRAATGMCDVAEKCSGTSAGCPMDKFATAGTPCRAAVGTCDVAEACTGTSAACPSDVLVAANTVCRAAAGVCDVVERCSGVSGTCPADGFVAAGVVCGPSTGVCDAADTCSGASASCPASPPLPDRDVDTVCDAGDNCPAIFNPDQRNSDGVGKGDVCDPCPAAGDNADCNVQQSTAATATESGKTLTVPDGTIALQVPPATLTTPTSVSITGGLPTSGFGLKTSDKTPLLAEFEPAGVQFNPPMVITFTWKDVNDDCFVDDPTKTCSPPTKPRGPFDPCPTTPASCDLNLNELEQLQVWRNGKEYPRPGFYCVSDLSAPPNKVLGCDPKANTWSIAVTQFSEYVLGGATCSAQEKTDLQVSNLLTVPGDEKVRFVGRFTIDVPIVPALDPIANGVSIVVETATGKQVLAQQVPGGAVDPVTKLGWKKALDRDTWLYKGKPPGVKAAKVSLLSAAEGRVKVNLQARGLAAPALGAEDLPLKARVYVDGRCGDAVYPGPAPAPRCRFNTDQSRIDCD